MKTRFLNVFRKFHNRVTQGVLLVSCFTGQALADLPAVEAPTGGGGGGTYNQFLGYLKMGALLMGLLVCIAAFLAVAHAVITSFHDIRIGKGSWSQFLGYLVVGIVVILLTIYLATKASEVL